MGQLWPMQSCLLDRIEIAALHFSLGCTICCCFDSQNLFDSSLEDLQMLIAQEGFVAGCGVKQAKVNSSACAAFLFLPVSRALSRHNV